MNYKYFTLKKVKIFFVIIFFTFLSNLPLFANTLTSPQINISVSGLDVSLSWKAVENATGYRLYYAAYPYLGDDTIGNIDLASDLQFSATLTNGAAFYVAVKAYNDSESSNYSNIELFQATEKEINLPSGLIMFELPAGTFTMGNNNLLGPQTGQATEHEVTLSTFQMSETEVSNTHYLEFLNAALLQGLVKVEIASAGADAGQSLVVGADSSSYAGKVLYNLSGIRVMKDHDNLDGDSDEFTGVIEPENPMNIAYIGFNEETQLFYLKDPHNVTDFHWKNICNYYNYSAETHVNDTSVLLNDFESWSELQGWTESNPELATSLASKDTIANYPVTFIRWWGAFAFADFYQMKLPSEAQWEYAAKGGNNFQYAVFDGITTTDANWNSRKLSPATHHINSVKSGQVNPFGLYNLGGNVWEWIADNYTSYSAEAKNNPLIEVESSTSRSWRGGSWNYHEATLKTSARYYDDENRGNDHFGFRIVNKNQ